MKKQKNIFLCFMTLLFLILASRSVQASAAVKVKEACNKNCYSVALLEDNTLWHWGVMPSVTKDGDDFSFQVYYDLTQGTIRQRPELLMENVKKVVLGDVHHYALITMDGSLYTWGSNVYGELGVGDSVGLKTEIPQRVIIPGKESCQVKDVILGQNTTAAILSDGTLWTWGDNSTYQLGYMESEKGRPKQVPLPGKVKQLSVETFNMAAVLEDGQLYAWGSDWYGELGPQKISENKYSEGPLFISDNVAKVSCGTYTTLFIKTDNTLWGCGSNKNGTLGLGSNITETREPMQILSNVKDVLAGKSYCAALALCNDGSLWAWGNNKNGTVGNGQSASFVPTPVQVLRQGVKQIADNHYGAIQGVISGDNSLYLWGTLDKAYIAGASNDRQYYQLTPLKIMDHVKQSCLGSDNFAIKEDGTLWGWGSNSYYELGDGTTTKRIYPHRIFINEEMETTHNWQEIKRTKGNCYFNTGDTVEYYCSTCGETKTETFPGEHQWDNGNIIQKPTYTQAGSKKYICTACGKAKYEKIPMLSEPIGGGKSDAVPKIAGSSTRIAAGKKITLTLTDKSLAKGAVWSSSNKKVAAVNQKGVVTLKKNSGGKTVTITVKAANGKKASYRIKSMKGIVKKITVKGAKAVKAGKSLKLKAKVAATKGANKKLIWKSSNTKYAKVNSSGKVKTLKAGKRKTVKITAMATDGSGKKKTVKIKIK